MQRGTKVLGVLEGLGGSSLRLGQLSAADLPMIASWKRFRASFGRFLKAFWGARDLIFKLFRCCPRTLRLLPLCPSNAGSAGARASAYNPPTTACGATSVFETPSVLRESLPSYSAKPGAFYAPRAHSAGPLRPEVELTPSKVRKSNPCFIDFRCFFKTIWESKMEAKMEATFV